MKTFNIDIDEECKTVTQSVEMKTHDEYLYDDLVSLVNCGKIRDRVMDNNNLRVHIRCIKFPI